jgi:plasmid stabilization system protein ParE
VRFGYELFPPAAADIDDIVDWYSRQAPHEVMRFYGFLDEAISRMTYSPHSYADQGDGLRSVGLKKFPYRIWFVPEDTKVVIILVIHTSRDPALVDQRLQDYLASR